MILEELKMKKIFTSNLDINKTAYLNWRTEKHQPIHNMNVLADGYLKGALILSRQCLVDNNDKKADILIYPILFSVNQAIELYAKSICWSLNILLGYKSSYIENHDIRGILLTVKQKVNEFGFDSPGSGEQNFNEMIKPLDLYIDELYLKIGKNGEINTAFHNIDFSRYPINNRKENHFYVNEYDNIVIDLENFIDVFENIYDCLSRLAGYYYNLVFESWQKND